MGWIWSHLGDTLMGVFGVFAEFEVKKEIHVNVDGTIL